MAAAGVEPERLDEGDLAFRLGAADQRGRAALPRRRRRRADADRGPERGPRRSPPSSTAPTASAATTEREVSTPPQRRCASCRPSCARRPAWSSPGEGWHPGVVGIVASRIVERHHRPGVLLSIDADGRGEGSRPQHRRLRPARCAGRCAEHLTASAATARRPGSSSRPSGSTRSARAFAAHAASSRRPRTCARAGADRRGGRRRAPRHRARRGARAARALRPGATRRAPARALAPASSEVRPMGEERQARPLQPQQRLLPAAGVAFTRTARSPRHRPSPSDAAVRLEVNHWNGAVEPRVVLERSRPAGEGRRGEASPLPTVAARQRGRRRLVAAVRGRSSAPISTRRRGPPAEAEVQRRDRSVAGGARGRPIGELLSSGGRVLVVCADARAGRSSAAGATAGRFGGAAPRCSARAARRRRATRLAADGAQPAARRLGGARRGAGSRPTGLRARRPRRPAAEPGRGRWLAADPRLGLPARAPGRGPSGAAGRCWAPSAGSGARALAEISAALVRGPARRAQGLRRAARRRRPLRRSPEVAARCVRVLG